MSYQEIFTFAWNLIITTGLRKLIALMLGLSILKFFISIIIRETKKKTDKGFSGVLSKKRGRKKSAGDYYDGFSINNYYKKRNLFTSREDVFFRKLIKILYGMGNRYIIFSKVRVVDVIAATSGNINAWKVISSWHFDYIICDALSGFETVMVIELDDETHTEEFAAKRDIMKNNVCHHVGLPLIRFNPDYTDELIRENLKNVLKIEFNPEKISL